MTKFLAFISISFLCLPAFLYAKIDRKSVVERNNIYLSKVGEASPSQVGNGEFAFSCDISGLQTFIPFNTMAQWGWHSTPLPEHLKNIAFDGVNLESASGKSINYFADLSSTKLHSKLFAKNNARDDASQYEQNQKELAEYLAANPHRINLGRIGLIIEKSDGTRADISDIKNAAQKVDLYNGVIESTFEVEGEKIEVITVCHPSRDLISAQIKSPLLKENRISVFFGFPYPNASPQFQFFAGDWNSDSKHKTSLLEKNKNSALLHREIDRDNYFVGISWESNADFARTQSVLYPRPYSNALPRNKHFYAIRPTKNIDDSLSFSAEFSKARPNLKDIPDFTETKSRARASWNRFWEEGAAADFSKSKNGAWRELERRMVLSRYLMRVNCAGSLPPQESGLISNSWFGRYHMEMIFWHISHFPIWGQPDLAKKQTSVYPRFLESAKETARRQGYAGARWPKCCAATSPTDWPHIIHATLLWQQASPIWFAEQEYRTSPTKDTLEKWKDIVSESADFIASFATYNPEKQKYELLPPISMVSEISDPLETKNPAFELAFWRYALKTAIKWQKRLGEEENKKWTAVLDNLSDYPTENGVYVSHEGIRDMWTKMNFNHPAILGICGMLPPENVDSAIFKATLLKIKSDWNWEKVWGWDFPLAAMAAARTGMRELALEFLLSNSENFRFDEHGLTSGGPCPYLPANGAFLTALGMMLSGWDNASPDAFDPKYFAFPKDGTWVIEAEGFAKYQ